MFSVRQTVMFWLGLISLFPLIVWIFVRVSGANPPATPVPPLGATLGQPPATLGQSLSLAEGRALVGEWPLHFLDSSQQWSWQNECGEALAAFAVGHGIPLLPTAFHLMDEVDHLPMGVAYPGVADPQALALVGCEEQGDGLACQMGLVQAAGVAQAETALSVALAVGLYEWARPKDRENWQAQRPWDWSDFQPLVQAGEDGDWHSTCLGLVKAE
jgi:hypothetical protein